MIFQTDRVNEHHWPNIDKLNDGEKYSQSINVAKPDDMNFVSKEVEKSPSTPKL